MRNIKITLTLTERIVKKLHLYIPKKQISKFVSKMIENGLEKEKQKLAKEVQEARQDVERNAEIEIWDEA